MCGFEGITHPERSEIGLASFTYRTQAAMKEHHPRGGNREERKNDYANKKLSQGMFSLSSPIRHSRIADGLSEEMKGHTSHELLHSQPCGYETEQARIGFPERVRKQSE